MRGLLCLVLCCVVGVQVILAQQRQYTPYVLRIEDLLRTNVLGPITVHSAVGVLPAKYVPINYSDEIASAKAIALFPELLRNFPDVSLETSLEPIIMDYPELWLRGKLYLTNIKVEGIHQIQLEDLEIRTVNKRVDFEAYAPRISVTADFKSEAHIGMVPLFLSGSLSVNNKDVEIVGAVSTKKANVPLIGEVYQVDAADVNVRISKIDIRLNEANGRQVPNLDTIMEHMVQQLKDKIADAILPAVLKQVNNELAKVPAAVIDGHLLNTELL